MRIEELISKEQQLIPVGEGRYLKGSVNDSLVIDTKRQLFFWNSKGIAGNSVDWLVKIKGMSTEDAYAFVGRYAVPPSPLSYYKKIEKKFVVSPSLVSSFFEFGRDYRDYWLDRGYKHSTIDYFRLGYTGEWYTIPIWLDGEFRNFQCRKPKPKRMKPWYRGTGALPYNFDILKTCKEYCILTEGPPDAIMLHQNGLPTVSQTVGAMGWRVYRKYFMRLYPIEKIFVCYDNDKAGDMGAVELALQLFGPRVKIYNFWDFDDGFDVSDYFNEGGNAKEFMSLLESESKYWYEVKSRE